WLERTDGHWFYVEQAVGTHLDIPYRQRIYHLAQMGENRFSSDIFTFPNPDLYIGKWAVPETFSSLTPDSLLSRDGCTVFITRQDEKTFSGSTEGKNCASSLGDAAYATSQVTITKDYILSWDRGFDSNDMQAWGAVTGGYLFNRIKSY
nr:chromophore lyase CpcT/CpeT [FCB group bacterium]